MNKEEIKNFLRIRKGYLKEGADRLRRTLVSRGYSVKYSDCKKALREVRKENSFNNNRDSYIAGYDPYDKPKKIKRLFYDIETSFNIGFFWSSGYNQTITSDQIIHERAIISISWKWEGEDKVYSKSWNNGCDKELVETFIELMNESDEIVGHNCVEENTKVLKNDLTWVSAKDLKVGDELVGFEEGHNGTCRSKNGSWNGSGVANGYRKYKKSIVTGHEIKPAKVFKVTFDDNTFVEVTEDHKWLGVALKDNNYRWRKTSELQIGYRCPKPFNVWKEQNDYNAGYLAGIIEADGHITKDGYYNISIYQSSSKNKDIFEKILNILDEENINYSVDNTNTSKIISTTYKGKPGIIHHNAIDSSNNTIRILGSVYDKIEFIGKYNIQKGKRIFNADNLGYLRIPIENYRTIINIEEVGIKNVVVMQTSEKTFIAEGYLMHNCDRFDTSFIMTRALFHGILALPKYNSFDTFKKAKSIFNFNSNKLDYLAKLLGLEGKYKHSGIQMWKDIVFYDVLNKGSKEARDAALKEMITYNEMDVILTEEVFNRLRLYTTQKVHHGVLMGKPKFSCPNDGSENVIFVKTIVTALGTIKHIMQCNDCKQQFIISNSEYLKYLKSN